MNKKLTAVDLFSGGGGLSEGLRQAGFDVTSAVEVDFNAISTYQANHPDTKVISTDIRLLASSVIREILGERQLDLLAACPPCQGFSTLTRAKKNEDPRNKLITEVSRLIKDLLPKTIMIENVPGLISRGESYLSDFLKTLDTLGYKYNFSVLQVADYGVPQMRKRFVLLAGLGFEIQIPKKTHSEKGCSETLPWETVANAIKGMPDPKTMGDVSSIKDASKFNWHITRVVSEITKQRLSFIKPGGSRFDLPDELRPNCHKGKNTGYSNVYGRMDWNKPSPTITSGCTTLSKGRFGHPEKLRTISIREAAILQTFPVEYKFDATSVDDVCKIIGNALPCLFAKKMADACKDALLDNATISA